MKKLLFIFSYLHSSMDRLETFKSNSIIILHPQIYIPVLIDQKLYTNCTCKIQTMNLHSSMDRLETLKNYYIKKYRGKFTFQYGQIRNQNNKNNLYIKEQIYIPVWIDQKPRRWRNKTNSCNNLHSSMDRLETLQTSETTESEPLFTFQYGQIRNAVQRKATDLAKAFTFQYGQIRNQLLAEMNARGGIIYIPVWIDQKHILAFRLY